jgi:hypothetical protein
MLATDVYLGAWLLHSGAVLKGVQVSRAAGKTTAIFDLDGPGIEEHAARFYREEAEVNLAAYRRHLEALKDQLFDALRRNDAERRTDDVHRYVRSRPLARR